MYRRDEDMSRNNGYWKNDGRFGGGRGFNGGRGDDRGFKRRAEADEGYWNKEEDLRQKLIRDHEYRGANRDWREPDPTEKCFRCGEEGHHMVSFSIVFMFLLLKMKLLTAQSQR